MEEVELWQRLKGLGDDNAREQLILLHLPLAKSLARRAWYRYVPKNVSRDDVAQYATLGLIDAVDRFDPDRGSAFASYAARRIHGAIVDGLREESWIPRSAAQHNRQLREPMPALEQHLQRTPTDDDMAEKLGLSREEFDLFKKRATLATLVSLDEPVGVSARGRVETLVGTGDPAEAYAELAQRAFLRDQVQRTPVRTKAMLALYYYHGMTLLEISQAFGLTEGRISQILTKEARRMLPLMLEPGPDRRKRDAGPPDQERRKSVQRPVRG